ncbi:MAG: hypothetical protein PVI01_12765 [Gemmatimonadales bacterium]
MTRYSKSLAVTFLSASTLAYEVLLVRVFAIEQFHHFAYMAISIAMLGFGTSGTWLALVRPQAEASRRWFVWTAIFVPPTLVASVTLVQLIPLDSVLLLWDPRQWPRLAAVYVLLALPFGVAALAILLAITLERERPGWTYGASFLGSGLGAAVAVGILWWVLPVRAVALPVIIAACGSLSAVRGAHGRQRVAAWACAALAVAVFVRPLWTLEIIPYKGLAQVESFPEARRIAESTSPVGWVVAVEAAAFRYAPGLSLGYAGEFPRQTALFVDAELAGAASAWDGRRSLDILDWLPSAAPYALGGRDSVLVVGAGGGTEIWNAVAHGARRVAAVELNPDLAKLSGWGAGASALGIEADVEWVVGDARGYVARSNATFDLITLGAGRAFGTSAGGVHALNEDFLHTVEAYSRYLELLSEGGVLAITRWITVPPRENVRVILTAAEALRRRAPASVARGLVVLRSWATGTVLVKPAGFSEREIAALSRWAAERSFDLDWFPGLGAPQPVYNILDPPVLFDASVAATVGRDSAARFAASYVFSVKPLEDKRPYFHHFLRVNSIGDFLGVERGNWLAFAEWGYITLFATFAQSVVLAGLLMILPALVRLRSGGPQSGARLIGYFAAIGYAYLAAEMAAIQQLSLLLGHPVYAVAAVLAAFLVCSGAGSAWSDRLDVDRLPWTAAILTVLLVGYAAALLSVVHLVQPGQLGLRLVAALLVLAPLAFLMGLPFPLGLRSLAGIGGEGVAWAWSANGFASVVATPLAALIALELGSKALFLTAAAAYGIAATLGRISAQRSVAVGG